MMAQALSSRERVLRAIDHQETDRLPRNLRADPPLIEGMLRTLGLVDQAALLDRLQIDIERVRVGYRCPYTDGRDIWGLRRESAELTERVSVHPLAEATTVDEVRAYAWPDPDWADVVAFRQGAIAARRTGRAVIGSSRGTVLGEACRLMGMDDFFVAMALYPDVATAVVEHVTAFFLEVDRRLFAACDGLLDISFYLNDFGGQKGLLFSRAMFQQFFAVCTKRLIDQAKGHGMQAMYHSCGGVAEVIPDLIACGVDVLDPVQVTAAGMQPSDLKSQFGSRISFHGAISAQKVLPLGTPDEVREHVRETCEIMRVGGGYIFTSDQTITHDTPLVNVLAMYAAIHELRF